MESQSFSEQLEATVKEKVDQAIKNAMTVNKFNDLVGKIAKASSKDKRDEKEKEFRQEMVESSAIADDLTEFHELLRQVADIVKQDEEWVIKMLAHENAHANVALKTGHEWGTYGVLFLKNNGRLSTLQPYFIFQTPEEWSEVEKIVKRIEVNKAPDVYMNPDGVHDNVAVKRDLDLLKQMDQKEVKRVRKSLDLE